MKKFQPVLINYFGRPKSRQQTEQISVPWIAHLQLHERFWQLRCAQLAIPQSD